MTQFDSYGNVIAQTPAGEERSAGAPINMAGFPLRNAGSIGWSDPLTVTGITNNRLSLTTHSNVLLDIPGGATITDIEAPRDAVGILLIVNRNLTAPVFQHNAGLQLYAGQNLSLQNGAAVLLVQTEQNLWREVSRSSPLNLDQFIANVEAATAAANTAAAAATAAADPAVTSIGSLTYAAGDLILATGPDAFAVSPTTLYGRGFWSLADAAAGRTHLGLVVGTDVQAFDADLTQIAALTSAANMVPYATGPGTWAMTGLSPYGRSLIDDATAGDALTTLGVSAFIKTLLDDADAAAARATLAIPSGGLVLINRTVVSAAVATVDVIFDATKYDQIDVMLDGMIPGTATVQLQMRLGDATAGAFDATDYGYNYLYSSGTTVGAGSSESLGIVPIHAYNQPAVGPGYSGCLSILGPGTTAPTRLVASGGMGIQQTNTKGQSNLAKTHGSFRLFFSAGNVLAGTITTWGRVKS